MDDIYVPFNQTEFMTRVHLRKDGIKTTTTMLEAENIKPYARDFNRNNG